jgi:hypothetical protein
MPAFLIVHSACPDGRVDAYLQPPTLDVGGLRAPLDWGDVTLHVPAGDLPVTVFVTRPSGQVEGARITVRTPAGTGTRLTFVPPLQPGGQSLLRIDGQWPSDSSMHYYAARDARMLARPAPVAASAQPMSAPGVHPMSSPAAAPMSSPAAAPMSAPGAQPMSAPTSSPVPPARQAPMAPQPASPMPPVGPAPGSTAEVPPQPSAFGHQQGARVDPVQASPVAPASQPHPAPSFGQRPPVVERGAQTPPIPTPAEFQRLEQEAHEAQRRAYEAWQAQQQPQQAAAPPAQEGAPQPLGLQSTPGLAAPGWYPDPFHRAEARWFDGHQWTSSVLRGGVRGVDQPG